MATGRMQRFYDQEGQYVSIEELIDWVRAHPLGDGRILPIIIWGGFGVGKCVRGDTPIWINGHQEKIEELWQSSQNPVSFDSDGSGGEWKSPEQKMTVPSLADSGEVVQGKVSYIYRQRVREMGRKVVLDDGSEITMTQRHRLRGVDGWQRNISVGDKICVPKSFSWKGHEVDSRLTRLLAWQIAEGYESTTRATVEISQNNDQSLRDLRNDALSWAKKVGVKMGAANIYLDERSNVYRLVINSSDYKNWLESKGYTWGQNSKDKSIPSWIVGADEDSIRLFLSNYISCEGHIHNNAAKLEVSSASREIIEQLNVMLRRLGVWARISSKMSSASNGSGKKRKYYKLSVSGNSFYRLFEQIHISDSKKQARVDNRLEARKDYARSKNTNTEGIPLSDLVDDLLAVTDLPKRRLGIDRNVISGQSASLATAEEVLEATLSIANGSALSDFQNSSFAQQSKHPYFQTVSSRLENVDKVKVEKIAERMSSRIEDSVYYARVISVEDVWLDEWVYDLEVEEHHNYVAGGLICHNTQQIKAYGRKRNMEIRTYHPAHDVNGADIVGKAYRSEQSGDTEYALPAWLPRDDGADPENGLLFIDELNRAPEEVLAGLMEPLGEGTIAQSGWKLPRGWNIIAAANPSEMGYMVHELDEAMVDRMIHYAPGWDARYWGAWAESADIDQEIINFALEHQGTLVSTGEAQLPLEIENKLRTTPRTLEYMGALYEPGMPEGLLRVCTDGLMGREPGAVFREMLVREEVPLSGEEILREPEDTGNGLVYPYDDKVRRWAQDQVNGEPLIQASSERLVIHLLAETPSSDDPKENRAASLTGRYLAFIPVHLREAALDSFARSAPAWLPAIKTAILGWTKALAEQQQVYTRRNSLPPEQPAFSSEQSSLPPEPHEVPFEQAPPPTLPSEQPPLPPDPGAFPQPAPPGAEPQGTPGQDLPLPEAPQAPQMPFAEEAPPSDPPDTLA